MEEKNIISEEDLEKAAGGLHMSKDTLKKCLIGGGVLLGAAAVGAAGVGGYVIYNKKKGSKGSTPSEENYADVTVEGEFDPPGDDWKK